MRIRNFQQKISTAWILSGFVFGMILWLSPFIDNAIGCGPPPCYTCPPCWTGCYCDNYVGCPPCDSSECLQCGASHCTCTSWCSGGTCCHGNCCPYPGMNCCPDGHCCSSGYSCCGNKCCHPGTTHCCSDGPPGSEYYCCPDGQTCCHGHCCVPSACDECVDGLCKVCGGRAYESCCNGTCYDTRTQKCCELGGLHICDINETCCDGSCCDPTACEDCNATTHACESKCKPENCETCDGASHCIVCGGDTTKCCDKPDVGPPGCKPKCTNSAQCDYGTLPPDPHLSCASVDPGGGGGCDEGTEGAICGYIISYYYHKDAQCANCAPGCFTHSTDVCLIITTETCKEKCEGMICICQCLAEYSGYLGNHRVCGL